jgi:hypothetical protein
MAKEATQTKTGKAFEYSLLNAFLARLEVLTSVSVVVNEPYKTAKKHFESFNEKDKGLYNLNASFAVNYLIEMEPRLANGIDKKDILQLEIVSDVKGQSGDVRDVLAIRSSQKWEIGISAKNNHRAVKHSRLSRKINFGKKWLGIETDSNNYFEEINPIFNHLANLRKASNKTQTWESLGDYHSSVYVPILDAFKKELIRLDKENPGIVAQKLVEYLVGNKDFYKVIKGKHEVEIQAYNLYGTLNQPFQNIKSKYKIQRLKLPNRLIEIVYQDNSKTTLIVSLTDGWQISFRIHNASSKIESSLKFDINLNSNPNSLFNSKFTLG